jgi:hypothetical protein
MKIRVERTLTNFRLTLPNGARESVSYHGGDSWWCKSYATQALDMLVNLYGLNRSKIRFEHR